jgi:hypothetical protein
MFFCSVAVRQPRRDKTTISFAFPKCFAKKMIKQLTLKDESFVCILCAFCVHFVCILWSFDFVDFVDHFVDFVDFVDHFVDFVDFSALGAFL